MLKCKICGCEFDAVKEKHYISRNNVKIGLTAAFGSNPECVLYDTFDCPTCGCQIIAQERKREYDLRKNKDCGGKNADIDNQEKVV